MSVERRGRGSKAAAAGDVTTDDVRTNLIYTATESPTTTDQTSADHITARGSKPCMSADRPSDTGDKWRRGTADQPRPVPKPRTASTSSTLDPAAPSTPSLDQSLELKPRPRARGGSLESLDRSFDDPQHRPRLRGSHESLDDKPVPKHRPRGSVESLERLADRPKADRPTPAMRRSQESLEDVGRPKPRARGESLGDRSLDESDASTQRPTNRPAVAAKQTRKQPANRAAAGKDRAMISSDETDV